LGLLPLVGRRQEPYKIQDLPLPIYHALCLALEDRFFGEEVSK